MQTPGESREEPRRYDPVVHGVSPWLVAALLVAVAALLLGYFRPIAPSALHDSGAKARPVTARGDLAADEKATIELFREARGSVVHITSIAVVASSRFSLDLTAIPQGTGTGFMPRLPWMKVSRGTIEAWNPFYPMSPRLSPGADPRISRSS